MKTRDLDFQYPKSLVATERKKNSRVMLVDESTPRETSVGAILNEIQPEDILVVNTTKVIPARVFSDTGLEVLFIEPVVGSGDRQWQVLCPARKWPKGSSLLLPGGIELRLIERGLPQIVEASAPINLQFFEAHGDWPLPPYIQEQRGQRQARVEDAEMYQTDWARDWGSLAAPTASFHFRQSDLEKLKARGATIVELVLHVGLGTFLPVHAEELKDHKMHTEAVEISVASWEQILKARDRGGKVWALGSTVTRALEAQVRGHFSQDGSGARYYGGTDLFITPGFEFQIVDVLMTNFHQPKSTLVAMVMAFAGIDAVRDCYSWAIERKFRLFSYGDLSVWRK